MGSSDSRPLNGKSTALDVMEYFAVERGEGQRFLEGKTAVVTVSNQSKRCCIVHFTLYNIFQTWS